MITRKKIKKAFREYRQPSHIKDCEKIINSIKSKFGVDISIYEANIFWQWYSDTWAASWLSLPEKDEEICECFEDFVNSFSS